MLTPEGRGDEIESGDTIGGSREDGARHPPGTRLEPEPAAAREGARRCSHWLECDIVPVLRCEDLCVAVARKQIHADSACGSRD